MLNKRIIVATRNEHKLREIREILLGYEILGLDELNIDHETVEDGKTFEENAAKKAAEICEIIGIPVLADDSGIEIDALGGEPGVYSARYAGSHGDSRANNLLVLEKMKNVPMNERTARFVCAMCIAYPNGDKKIAVGKTDGIVLEEEQGENGFGYDPLFFVPELGKTFAEVSAEEKNKISHRRRALEKIKELL